MGNKIAEQECLKKVFELGKKQGGFTKRLLQELGEPIQLDSERPDFVFCKGPKNKHEKKTYIGIEHFAVDSLAFQDKKGIMQSATQMELNKIDKFTKANVGKEPNLDTLNTLNDIMADHVKSIASAGYNGFGIALHDTLMAHNENITAYRQNIKEKYKTNDIKIAFLIDITVDFSRLFITDNTFTYYVKSGELPITDDIVKLLSQVKKNVYYIILCIHSSLEKTIPKIIMVRTASIENDLKRQKVKIYHYAAYDYYLDFSILKGITVTHEEYREGDNIETTYTLKGNQLSNEYITKVVNSSFARACWALDNKKPYVSDIITLMMMDVYKDFVIKWEKGTKEEPWAVTPIYNNFINTEIGKRVIEERKQEFLEKYKEYLADDKACRIDQ